MGPLAPSLSLALGRRAPAAPAVVIPSPPTIAEAINWWIPEDLPALGQPVTSWPDGINVGDTYAQSTGLSRPTVIAAVNGLRAARFDGVDDVLNIFSNAIPAVRTPSAALIVVRYTQEPSGGTVLFGHSTLYDWHGGHPGTGDGDRVLNATLSSASLRDGSVRINGAVWIPSHVVKPTVWTALLFLGTGPTSIENFGCDRAGNWTAMDVAEVAFFSAVPSAGDLAALNAYLLTKYSLTQGPDE